MRKEVGLNMDRFHDRRKLQYDSMSFIVGARIDDFSHSARLFILCDQVAGTTAFRLVGI